MTQQTKSVNLAKFEAGDRPTDQDFTDLFDSILFTNESNGLSSNKTILLGDLDIGGSLSILGGGNIAISGSFSAGDPTAGVAGGRISAFTATDSPPFYASSSISEVMFSGISSKTTSSIALTTKGSNELTSGDVRFGIENGKGFLDAQGTTVISYSTGSSATAGGDNIIHMSASVGIGTATPAHPLNISTANNTTALGIDIGANANFDFAANSTSGYNTTFNMDNTGLDIGHNSSTRALNLKTNSADRLTIEGGGNVGIGTPTPTDKLDIAGAARFTSNVSFNSGQAGRIYKDSSHGLAIQGVAGSENDFAMFTPAGQLKIVVPTGTNNLILNRDSGDVGIGTSTPSAKLHVEGNTRLEPDDGNNNFLTFTSQASTQTNQHYYVGNNSTWNIFSSEENYHIRRAVQNPGTSPGTAKTYVTFHGGDATGGDHQGAEFHVPVTASFFKGDGSALTGITGGQITGFVQTPGDNRLVTSNATGDGVFGEANLTFDGSTLAFTSAAEDIYISFPLLSDATANTFRTALRFPSTDDRALLQYGTVANDDFELRLRLQDGNTDKFVIISDSTSDYRALDINGTRALFFSDNSAGKVGIGTTTPGETLTVAGNIEMTAAADRRIFMGGQSSATFGIAYSSGNPDFGIFYTEGSPDVVNISPNGNATAGVMTLLGTGNVGIGTTTPAAKLDVEGDIKVGGAITLFSAGAVANGPDIQFGSAGLIASEEHLNININSNGGSDDLFIRTGGGTNSATEVMRITSDGKLGLGGVDPSNDGINVYKNNNDTLDANDNKGQLLLENDGSTGDAGMVYLLTGVSRWKTFIDNSNDDAFTIRQTTSGKVGSYLTMKYNTAHYIGILESNPSYPLDVSGEARFQSQVRIDAGNKLVWSANTDSGFIVFNSTSDSASDLEIGTTDNGTEAIRFTLSGTEKARINGTGIQVESTVTSTSSTHTKITNSGGGYIEAKSNNSTYGLIIRDYNSSNWANLDANSGYLTIGYNSADGPLFLSDSDKVGIGVNNPSYKLHIVEPTSETIAKFTTDASNGYVRIRNVGDNNGAAGLLLEGGSAIRAFVGYDDSRIKLVYASGPSSTNGIIINSSGKVGIDCDSSSTTPLGGAAAKLSIGLSGRALDMRDGDGLGAGGLAFFAGASDTSHPITPIAGDIGQVNHGDVWMMAINGNSADTTGNFLYIWDGDAGGFFNYGDQGPISFTGQHFNRPSTGVSTDYEDKKGYIVVADGTYENFKGDRSAPNRYGPNLDESLCKVALSEQPNDKRVFGVISRCEKGDFREGGYSNFVSSYTIKENDHRLIINSIGEGAVLVSNMNGNLENGDYITTSHIEGLGMRQDDDLLHNYTVAKITQDCNFASETTDVTYNGVTYKTKLVGCTYHCG